MSSTWRAMARLTSTAYFQTAFLNVATSTALTAILYVKVAASNLDILAMTESNLKHA